MTTQATTAEAGVPDEPALEARLMTHAYDGIREYDNPLPGWWSAIFWATIVFAAGYGVFYHIGRWGKTPDQKYQAALATYEGQRGARDRAESASVSEDVLQRRAADPKTLADGRAVFVARCASCHTDDGRGLIGPNLTDDYQLHGHTRMDIYSTVKKGVAGTAMLAWGEQLPPADVIAVATYVTTLRGQNIPGKAREGQPVQPFTP
jgi:cytochrome c oxidase cbb3-type subunit 3